MKKLLVLLFAVAISLPSFAGLKEQDVVGKWTFKVETGEEAITGSLVFNMKEGKLSGEVSAGNSEVFPLANVELKENSVLYFELTPEYETFKITLTVKDKKFAGTVATENGDLPMTGERVE